MSAPETPHCVRHFRQILLWPLRLMPVRGSEAQHAKPWQILSAMGEATPWREVVDEYTGEAQHFHERHYNEFVTFLPYVQRFLYGEGHANGAGQVHGSPMRVFRRHDVRAVRAVLQAGQAPITLDVVHIDLYFFLDMDLVLLNVEVASDDLTLPEAQELLYRFGRGYPSGWDRQGQAQHCLHQAQWLGSQGEILAESDAGSRELFLEHVARHRAPRIASHWDWLLQPLVSDHSDQKGALRYRQIEYYRMPMLGFLAVDNPQSLSRSDFIRLGLVTGAGAQDADSALPFADDHLRDFEERYCYDRFWTPGGAAPYTRYLCTGHSLVVVGDASSQFFTCRDRGVLAQFRHQHFLLFLIAHFQKAAMLMFSDRLADTLRNLNISDPSSVRLFKRSIRSSFASFLRFTHRYWFHEVSEQAQTRALFAKCAQHLGLDPLYAEVKERIADMNNYLEADSLRRQANTVVRLTVVTILGLIGTITTGFLGMNLMAEAEASMERRVFIFVLVFVVTTALTVYTMAKSKRLSDFLDILSEERLGVWAKVKAFISIWARPRDKD